MFQMVENLEFRRVNDPFLNTCTLHEDKKEIRSSQNVLVFADKTRNLYEMDKAKYNQLLTENITKSYKLAHSNIVNNIIEDTKTVADTLDIADRMTTMAKNEAFITLKDHKSNFENNPKCRLINLAKSKLRRISKAYLHEINTNIRALTHVKQWRKTSTVIELFKNITHKCKHTFLPFNIVDFYPSISEDLLKKALTWASKITKILIQHIEVIMHARKSLLFSNERPWAKKDNSTTFHVSMGSFDGAEILRTARSVHFQ